MIRVALGLVAVALPAAASAQAYRCAVPADLPRPRPDGPSQSQPKRVVPITGYTLALSWTPQYCRDNSRDESAGFQCRSGSHFGFTLHGLWPDGAGERWPQYCAPASLLSEAVLRRNLCVTPSVQLLQHEYAKHGTCMGVPPARYFAQASGLYAKLRYPDMNALSRRQGLTVGAFATAFARANRGVTPAMLRISADRRGWLDEVRLCLDKRFAPARCPARRDGTAPSTRLKIWRGG